MSRVNPVNTFAERDHYSHIGYNDIIGNKNGNHIRLYHERFPCNNRRYWIAVYFIGSEAQFNCLAVEKKDAVLWIMGNATDETYINAVARENARLDKIRQKHAAAKRKRLSRK